MKPINFLVFFILVAFSMKAQVIEKDTIKMGYILTENDSILNDTIALPEIIIHREKLDPVAKKEFLMLQKRVYVVYPYAKLASERLTFLSKGLSKLSSNREKKKYFKIVENYLNNEFEAKLKKLSRKQGQILVKLIHRQTGITTFELVKNLKSGIKAFVANTTANLFDISLKTHYLPYEANEDYLIETILVRAFESGRLQYQKPAKLINYEELNESWLAKATKIN